MNQQPAHRRSRSSSMIAMPLATQSTVSHKNNLSSCFVVEDFQRDKRDHIEVDWNDEDDEIEIVRYVSSVDLPHQRSTITSSSQTMVSLLTDKTTVALTPVFNALPLGVVGNVKSNNSHEEEGEM